MSIECKHGYAEFESCDRCELEEQIERLRAFVAAFDEFSAVFNGYYAGEVVDAMLAAREAVGPCS